MDPFPTSRVPDRVLTVRDSCASIALDTARVQVSIPLALTFITLSKSSTVASDMGVWESLSICALISLGIVDKIWKERSKYPCCVNIMVDASKDSDRFIDHMLHACRICHVDREHEGAVVLVRRKAFTCLRYFRGFLLIDVCEGDGWNTGFGKGKSRFFTNASGGLVIVRAQGLSTKGLSNTGDKHDAS